MKIAFMTPGSIQSSLSYRPLAIARELKNRGHEVYIFAPRFDKYSNFIDKQITEIDGIKIMRPYQLPKISFDLGLIPYLVSSFFMLYRLNPDVVHLYKPNPVSFGGILLQLTKKTPVILDVDDADSEVMKIEKNSFLRVKLVELSEKIMAYQANAIIGCSRFLFNQYRSKFGKNKLIKYIPNGAEFRTDRQLNLQKGSSNRLLFIGNINRKNILEPLFYTVKDLSDKGIKINSLIIGDGAYLNYFKDLVKKLKLNNNIKFLGWIPQEKLSKYVHVGDIGYCYMPNEMTIKACSSMKVFQYMQYGAVPLVSNVGDLPRYIFNGKAGYIAKHTNSKSLTQTTLEALSLKRPRIGKVNYALKNAAGVYKWSVLTSDVERLYQKIV